MATKLTTLTHKWQFSHQAANPETFGYTVVFTCLQRNYNPQSQYLNIPKDIRTLDSAATGTGYSTSEMYFIVWL
jgi:hypothetical protein